MEFKIINKIILLSFSIFLFMSCKNNVNNSKKNNLQLLTTKFQIIV